MIGRIILESCYIVKEAIALLKAIPHRHSFSYVLLDKHGEKKVVEASPRKIAVHDAHICTNHFTYLTKENRYRMDDSIHRYTLMEQQSRHVSDSYQAFRMLNDTDKGVFSEKYGAWAGTLHTALYLPKIQSTWLALGGNRKPFIFNFSQWLKGTNTRVKQIKGELNANQGFVNMKYIT
ncbi:MAG: hypothetical protein ACFWT6_17970 [Virgibacillus proomii]|jgi:predicted choloylglycine hydrolase